jgi:hypothetical protein
VQREAAHPVIVAEEGVKTLIFLHYKQFDGLIPAPSK